MYFAHVERRTPPCSLHVYISRQARNFCVGSSTHKQCYQRLDLAFSACLQFPVCCPQRVGPLPRALCFGRALQDPLPTGCLPLIGSCATLHHQWHLPSRSKPGASGASRARHWEDRPQCQVPDQQHGSLHLPARVYTPTVGADTLGRDNMGLLHYFARIAKKTY